MEVACSAEMLDSTTSSSQCPMPVEHDHISCKYVPQYIRLTKNPAELLCCTVSVLPDHHCHHECAGVPQAIYWLTYGINDQWPDVGFPAWARYIMFTMESWQSLRLTHPPVKWIVRILCLVIKRQGMKVTIYVHLLVRLRMRGSMLPLPHVP
jgi:hypothetical protein